MVQLQLGQNYVVVVADNCAYVGVLSSLVERIDVMAVVVVEALAFVIDATVAVAEVSMVVCDDETVDVNQDHLVLNDQLVLLLEML